MAKVIMYSWNEGLLKVSLTKLQMSILGLSLLTAKSNADKLLDGHEVVFHIGSIDIANQFFHEIENIGVNCKLEVY